MVLNFGGTDFFPAKHRRAFVKSAPQKIIETRAMFDKYIATNYLVCLPMQA